MYTCFSLGKVGLLLAGAGFTMFSGAALAQTPTNALKSSCFVAPALLSDAEIGDFLASPTSLLSQFGSGGLPLANRARALVGSSGETLAPIIALLDDASAAQAAAIGAGLARAARACASVNPEYAAAIQDAVAESGNTSFETAFLAGGNDTTTASLAGAAGGGSPTGAAGIGGGGTPGGGVNGAVGGSDSVAAGNSTFSVNGGGSFFSNDDDEDSISVSPTLP